MTTAPTFCLCEIETFVPGAPFADEEQGFGVTPIGALTQFGEAVSSSGLILASDLGYRTSPADTDGPVAYPPLLADAFQVNVAMNFDPAQSGAAAAWGTLSLANLDGQWDSIAANWNSDGRPVTIRSGQKVLEDFAGPRTGRATPGTYIAADGTMQSADAGAVRWGYSSGAPVLLNEPAATNYIRNPRCEGAVAGTPGTSPTDWSIGVTPGLSQQVIGSGTDEGIPYFDVRFFGTTTGTSGTDFIPDTTRIAAAAGQTWTASIYVKMVAGSAANVLFFLCDIEEWNATKQIQDDATDAAAPTSVWTRYALTKTLTNPDTVAVRMRALQFGFSSAGLAVDITLRVGAPQFEIGAAATSVVLPPADSPGVATRAADNIYRARGIYLDPAYSDLTIMFAGLATPWFLADTALTIPLRDATYWLDQPFQTNLYLGTGAYEGTSDLTGAPKPRTRGGAAASPVCNVTPTQIDPTNRIYQYTDGAGTVVNLYEGAAKTITFASDTTDLYSGSTPAGQYRTDNSRGLFQLGSAPAHAITADVTGEFPSAGAITTAAEIALYLLTEDMQLPADNVDTASFVDAATAYPYVGGLYFDSTSAPTGTDAITEALAGFGAKLVPFRDGTLRLLMLRALPANTASVATFDTSNIVTLTPVTLPAAVSPPPYRIRVGYNHNYTVQSSDLNTATGTAAQLQFVASADRYGAWSSGAVLTQYRRPNDLAPVVGSLLVQDDANAVAADLGALWGVRRRLYSAVMPAAIVLAREIGDVVRVAFPMDDLASGQLGQIVGYAFDSTDSTVTVQILI